MISPAPSGPPANVTLFEVTSTSARVSWSEPACGQRNGDITAYSFLLLDEAGTVIENDDTTSTSVFINNLMPFTNHSFKVSAKTRRGIGPASPALHFLTEQGGL